MLNRLQMKSVLLENLYQDIYLRPFVKIGDDSKNSIFVVGTNPATSISMHEILIDEYVDSLFDSALFKAKYSKARISQGKSAVSKTRNNFERFIQIMTTNLGTNIYETNVITFPTKNIEELRSIPKTVIKKSIDVFFDLLSDISPLVILLHGSKTKEVFYDEMENRDYYTYFSENEDMYIQYQNGKKALILEVKHFMYYSDRSEHYKKILCRMKNEIGNAVET